MTSKHFDIIIIGAGLSGIGSACHVSRECPDKSLAILERRQTMGGTWDLFKYPGIRSDSDMASYGFQFKPWDSDTVLAKGTDIYNYVHETAAEFGINKKVHCGLKVTHANWNSATQLWQLTTLNEASGEIQHFSCNFFLNCSGYYNYEEGYRPHFSGEEEFEGKIIHPQHWPEDLDYTGKKVVVIGSGATAVTIVPAIADQAEHVTMLQRSPSYIMSVPDTDSISIFLKKFLPDHWVFLLARKRNIFVQRALYLISMRYPNAMRKFFLKHVAKQLNGASDMKHFTPDYNPWEQRLCATPDGEFFAKIRENKASIVTDHIDRFTSNGIQLKSGDEIKADIIVTATGLNLEMLGGLTLSVDNVETKLSDRMSYKSIMLEGLPNFAWVFGYTNGPWTLKCDLAGQYLCKLIKYMDKHNYGSSTPIDDNNNRTDQGLLDNFDPSYIQRAKHMLPRQGRSGPWRLEMHYGKDKKNLLHSPVNDGILKFEPSIASSKEQAEQHGSLA